VAVESFRRGEAPIAVVAGKFADWGSRRRRRDRGGRRRRLTTARINVLDVLCHQKRHVATIVRTLWTVHRSHLLVFHRHSHIFDDVEIVAQFLLLREDRERVDGVICSEPCGLKQLRMVQVLHELTGL
ncbi:hypothetical protein PMAYCL1PPCAC_31176, partial [Pristionchus mayeri]